MMNSEDFIKKMKEFETVHKSIVDGFASQMKSTANLKKTNELKILVTRNQKQMSDLEVERECKKEDIKKLEQEIAELKELLGLQDKTKNKLKSEVKILETAYNKGKKELDEVKLLEKSYKTLIGINIVPSQNNVCGYIENRKNGKLQPFSFKKGEDEINKKLSQLLKDVHN